MTLITCPECAKQVSSEAIACPHCGKPMGGVLTTPAAPASKSRARGWLLALVVVFVVLSPLHQLYKSVATILAASELDNIFPTGWRGAWLIVQLLRWPVEFYGVFSGILLLRLRAKAVRHAKAYLTMRLVVEFIVGLVIWPVPNNPANESKFFVSVIWALFWSVVYFFVARTILKRTTQLDIGAG